MATLTFVFFLFHLNLKKKKKKKKAKKKEKKPTLGSISEAQADTWENNSARGGGYEFVTMQIEPKA